jgi:hypothetical protein
VSLGSVFDEAFALYKAHWQHLMGVAAVYYVVMSAVVLALVVAFGNWGAVAGSFVNLVGVFWLTGALVEAVADIRDGRAELTLPETFRRIGPRVPVLLGASILAGFGIVLGLLLLIVPGLILLTWWSLITATIVLERKGVFESFGRSRELVRGHGWTVFGVLILTLLLSAVVSSVIAGIFLFLPGYLGNYLGNAAGGTVTAPFQALTVTVMYFTLSAHTTPPPEAVVQPASR